MGLLTQLALVFACGVGGCYNGIAAHYQYGLFERVARNRALPTASCYIASDFHKLGSYVDVYGINTRRSLRCMVADVSKEKDRKRHIQQRLFELDFISARILCGSTKLRNDECPVLVTKQEKHEKNKTVICACVCSYGTSVAEKCGCGSCIYGRCTKY